MRRHRPVMNAMKNPCACQNANPAPQFRAGVRYGGYSNAPGCYMGTNGQMICPGAVRTTGGPSAACPTSAPYVCTGFPNQCSAYPPDHPLHGIDCKSYTTPKPKSPAAYAFAGNPSVAHVAGPPAPARVPAWQPSSPYWRAGLATAAALSSGAVPSCPSGFVPRAWGQNWYCVPRIWPFGR